MAHRRRIPRERPRRHRRGTAGRPARHRGSDPRRTGPPPARLRPRPAHEVRAGRAHLAGRDPARTHPRLTGRHRDRQQRVGEERQVARGDVARARRDSRAADPTAARPRRPRGDAEVRLHRRARRPGAGVGPRDGGPGRGRQRGQGVARGTGRAGAQPRRADGPGRFEVDATTDRRGPRRCRRVSGPVLRPRGGSGHDRGDQSDGQGRRLVGRRGRGAGLRRPRRPRQPRPLGPQAGRPHRPSVDEHPGRQGGRDRRRLRGRRPARERRPPRLASTGGSRRTRAASRAACRPASWWWPAPR